MSSSLPAVSVRGLGKAYRIHHERERPATLIEAAMRRLRGADRETFWALRDVSFDVGQGEIVGIIGRNGAGKSTLLKILSRITLPTEGAVDLVGRTGSLLEVGTGFHRELTGRENIYLNGGILGMKRSEIAARFDEIVAFAGTERFLDTPVKRYSSGMYVRLAFAVAAHLRPDILIVDEVLSVGDAEFQKKCLGRMGDAAGEGRTVLLVSHNMSAVLSLCPRVLLIDGGRIVADGPADDVVEQYLAGEVGDPDAPVAERAFAEDPDADAQVLRIALRGADNEAAADFGMLDPVTVEIDYIVRRSLPDLVVSAQVRSAADEVLLVSTDVDERIRAEGPGPRLHPREPGRYRARFALPAPFWNVGEYGTVAQLIAPRVRVVNRARGPGFTIRDADGAGTAPFSTPRRGHLAVPLRWEMFRHERQPHA